jgi:hypothetical protein
MIRNCLVILLSGNCVVIMAICFFMRYRSPKFVCFILLCTLKEMKVTALLNIFIKRKNKILKYILKIFILIL